MILTVTPNPSLDRTYEIPGSPAATCSGPPRDRVDPGGKGVNVSRALAAAGHRTVAVLPLGGAEGALLAALLGEQGIEAAGGRRRRRDPLNISLAEPDGTLTKINAAGPGAHRRPRRGPAGDRADRASADAPPGSSCCGSLPRGAAPRLVRRAGGARPPRPGARIALDTSGAGAGRGARRSGPTWSSRTPRNSPRPSAARWPLWATR